MKNNKKLLFVWQSDWPWDIRIDKEIKTFRKKGYEISIISRNKNKDKKEEIRDSVKIYRVGNYVKNNKLDKILSFPFYINPVWFMELYRVILKEKPDLIIIRDIPLALSVQFIAKMFKIKTVIDMAEPYPAHIKVNDKFMKNIFIRFLFKNLDWYQHIENKAVRQASHVFVVVEDNIERLCDKSKIPVDKISVVSNTPLLETISEKSLQNNTDKKLKIVYTGNVDGTFRDVLRVILALKILNNQNIEFNIVGDGSYLNEIEKVSRENNIPNINIIGKIPFGELLQYLNLQDVGIVPHDNSDYIKYTIPNKIFDYMAHSLPVIVSSTKPLKRVVEKTDCGYVYEACNEKSLADCINNIYNNKSELVQKGQNGYNAIKREYNWEKDGEIMASVIDKILKDEK